MTTSLDDDRAGGAFDAPAADPHGGDAAAAEGAEAFGYEAALPWLRPEVADGGAVLPR